MMLKHKKFVQKIHNPSNSTTQEFSDTSLDSGMGLLDIPISYPATPLDASCRQQVILLSTIEEKIFQQQRDKADGSLDQLALKPKEATWTQSFLELEHKYLQLSESYKNVLQENLRVQTENIKLKQELELSQKHNADLEIRLHGFQIGAGVFQKQYFMLQKQNIELAIKLCELQNTLTNVPFTQIGITQQHDLIPTLEEHQQNPQIVCAYENSKHNRRRHGNGNKSRSTLTVVPHQHEPYLHQQASYEAITHQPYKDTPVQHVPSQQQHMPYEVSTYQHVPSQQQHMPYEVSTYQHVPSQQEHMPHEDPLPQYALCEEIEETSVIIPENVEASSSSNTLAVQFEHTSDSYNLLRLVKLQYEHLAKQNMEKLKCIPI
jgi:hypothetical protein